MSRQYDTFSGDDAPGPTRQPRRTFVPPPAQPVPPISAPPAPPVVQAPAPARPVPPVFAPPAAPPAQAPPAPSPTDVTAQLPRFQPGPAPVSPAPRNNLQGPVEPPSQGSRWAVAMLAVFSVVCCWGYGVGIVIAVAGIIMSKVVKKGFVNANQPVPGDMKAWEIVSWVGLVASVIGTFVAILMHAASIFSPGDTGI